MFDQFCKRIRKILDVEQVGMDELKNLLGADYCYLKNGKPLPADGTVRLLKHRRLQKYALYLMTDQIAPVAGQISPDLAHCGRNVTSC